MIKMTISTILAISAAILITCGSPEKFTAISPIPDAIEQLRYFAFGKVLWDVYLSGTLPDGSRLEYRSTESAAGNDFAIADVDGDGQEELVLFWEGASMAGMAECVFGYNDGMVHIELGDFPSMTFYDNGIVEVDWSHNQGLAGRFWPYSVFRYDAELDVYQDFGSVDAWDKECREENYDDEPFPTDIDVDGDKLVYYIFPAGWNGLCDMPPLVDGPAFEDWRTSYLDGAEEITILRRKLTEENIAALGFPKPDTPLPQPAG